MTQITATLANEADPNLIQKIFENVKGVISTSVSFKTAEESGMESAMMREKTEWLDELHKLVNNVDRSVIDMNDDRTSYIMSK